MRKAPLVPLIFMMNRRTFFSRVAGVVGVVGVAKVLPTTPALPYAANSTWKHKMYYAPAGEKKAIQFTLDDFHRSFPIDLHELDND